MERNNINRSRLLAMVVGILTLGSAQLVHAAATGGEDLVNTVTVDYQSIGGQTYQDTASVTITVAAVYNLVWQDHTANVIKDSGTDPDSQLSLAETQVRLVNRGNISHAVTFADGTFPNPALTNNTLAIECNEATGNAFVTCADALVFNIAAFGIDKGAYTSGTTIPLTASDVDTFLGAQDIIEINGTEFTVTATTTNSVTVSADPATAIAAAGDDIVHEIVTFRAVGAVGELGVGVTQAHLTFDYTATDDDPDGPNVYPSNASEPGPLGDQFDVTVLGPLIEVKKYVRVKTGAGTPTGTCTDTVPIDGLTYTVVDGVACILEAVADDVLEYAIEIRNAEGLNAIDCGPNEANAATCAAAATAVLATDDLPEYTTLDQVLNDPANSIRSYNGCGELAAVDPDVVLGAGSETVGADGGSGELLVTADELRYVPNGDDTDLTTGNLAVDGSACLIYQVTVD